MDESDSDSDTTDIPAVWCHRGAVENMAHRRRPPPPSPLRGSSSSASGDDNRTFTSRELRRLIHDSYAALTSIQRQVYRGEGQYFEETCAHRGNVLQGWDNIWIENPNDVGGGGGGGGGNVGGASMMGPSVLGGGLGGGIGESATMDGSSNVHSNSSNAPVRKMPADYRWFSSSCAASIPLFGKTATTGGGGGGNAMGNIPHEMVVGLPALERPSLSIIGDDDSDDENDDRPVALQAEFSPDAAAKEGGEMEEEDEVEEEDEAGGGGGVRCKVSDIET